MEIEIAGNQIEMPDSMKSEGYGIGDAGMLMYILRSRIYSDALGSMVREVISNARDANAEANSDKPVRIVFPDQDFGTSELCVSDSGCGISEERMKHVFVMFCKSTKRQSKKEIGGFGLGCKTPFAYGDSFIVETVWERTGIAEFIEDGQTVHLGFAESDRVRLEKLAVEGKCKMCDALPVRVKQVWYHFLDKTGGSGYTLLSTDDTDAETGTTIKVPVKDDVSAFVQAVRHVAKWWEVKPETSLPITYDTKEVAFEGMTPSGRRWVLTKRTRRSDGTLADATQEFVVSGVPYKIVTRNFDDPEVGELLNNGIAIFFDQSEVPVTASREDVDYNPASIEFFSRVMREVRNDLLDKIEEAKKTMTSSQMALFSYRNGVEIGGIRWSAISIPRGITLYTTSDRYGNKRRQSQYSYDPKPTDVLIVRDIKNHLFARIDAIKARIGTTIPDEPADGIPNSYDDENTDGENRIRRFFSVEVDKGVTLPQEMLIATVVQASSVKITKASKAAAYMSYNGTARVCMADDYSKYSEMKVVPLAEAAAMTGAVFIERSQEGLFSGGVKLDKDDINQLGSVMIVMAPTSRIEAFTRHQKWADVKAKQETRKERRKALLTTVRLDDWNYRHMGHEFHLRIAKLFPQAFNGTLSTLLMHRLTKATLKTNKLLSVRDVTKEIDSDFLENTKVHKVKRNHMADYLVAKSSGRSITIEEFEKWVD